jgi:hypothetical protein
MLEIRRHSPVAFEASPARTENRDNWTVVLEYDNEGDGPYVMDLSHLSRWDVQDSALAAIAPGGVAIPEAYGSCALENGILINRMNRTQAAVWHLLPNPAQLPAESPFTDVSESTVFLGIVGEKVFAIAEKLSALDFSDPHKQPPFLLQGPFSHVPCQLVTLCRDAHKSGILFTCSRGYARDMVHAVMAAGAEFGLRPAGEERFREWLAAVSDS